VFTYTPPPQDYDVEYITNYYNNKCEYYYETEDDNTTYYGDSDGNESDDSEEALPFAVPSVTASEVNTVNTVTTTTTSIYPKEDEDDHYLTYCGGDERSDEEKEISREERRQTRIWLVRKYVTPRNEDKSERLLLLRKAVLYNALHYAKESDTTHVYRALGLV
jgi:hypothetical protein